MNFSRMHIGMIGIVSIFIGMIAPVVRGGSLGFGFAWTELQMIAYTTLFILAGLCICLAMRKWQILRYLGAVLIVLLGYLFMTSWTGELRSNSGLLLSGLSWGWIAIGVGVILLLISMIRGDTEVIDSYISEWILGWFGGVTILLLTCVIVWISYVPGSERSSKNKILENIFGSGEIQAQSGVSSSPLYPRIERLSFDRKNDALSFISISGSQVVSFPENISYESLPYDTLTIGDTLYTIMADGGVVASGTILGQAILPQDFGSTILYHTGGLLYTISQNEKRSLSGSYINIGDIHYSKNTEHIFWQSPTKTGSILYKDGEALGDIYTEISTIATSSDGNSVMLLVRDKKDATLSIVKNGVKIQNIEAGYISGSIRMNGTDNIYTIERDGVIEIVHNGSILDRKFDEIREIWLDTDGTGYVYFGRPLGQESYCLYTRYRGNLCGLTGYMNPRQAPDSSIIYAGLKDGEWGIYRNALPIISNTGYPNRDDISRDYVFFDITNPTYYVFIRGVDDGYQLYKKGAWIPGTYRDVGLDLTFGYNNKTIMSVQDDLGWRVIEF